VGTTGALFGEMNTNVRRRISRLENAVNRLLEKMGKTPVGDATYPSGSKTPPAITSHPPPPRHSNSNADTLMNDPSAAPVNVIRDLAAEVGVQSPEASRDINNGFQSEDVINEGLLSARDAVYLLSMYVLFVCQNLNIHITKIFLCFP
jgi:hypothetical protein